MNNRQNNKGNSLAELMVYMVLGVLVTGFALQAIGHISKNYVHGREVTKMQQSGRDAINVMSRDLANVGFKYYILKTKRTTTPDTMQYTIRPTATSPDSLFRKLCYMGARNTGVGVTADSVASFLHGNIATYDSIQFVRGNLGTRTDTIISVEKITYRVVSDVLYRCSQVNTTLASVTWSTRDSIAIIDNVKGLQFQFSVDGVTWNPNPTATLVRNTMKYIKVSLLTASDRKSDFGASGKAETVGDTTITRNDDRLYRTYEEVVPIPNNGVL